MDAGDGRKAAASREAVLHKEDFASDSRRICGNADKRAERLLPSVIDPFVLESGKAICFMIQ